VTRRSDPLAVHVVVPTTAGPVPILQLRPYPQLAYSTVVTPAYVEDAEVSRAYGLMLQPVGSLGRLLPDMPKGPWVLVLAERLDHGLSWQVPVVCAHVLLARGCRLVPTPGEAQLVVWATGAIALDVAASARAIAIRTEDYAVSRKLDASATLLAPADHGERLILIPPQRRDGNVAATPPPGDIRHVSTVGEVADALDGALRGLSPGNAEAGSEVPRPSMLDRLISRAPGRVAIVAGALMVGSAAALQFGLGPLGYDTVPDAPRPDVAPKPASVLPGAPSAEAAATPDTALSLLRLSGESKSTCLESFDGRTPYVEETLHAGADGAFSVAGGRSLCGLRLMPAPGWRIRHITGLEAQELRRSPTGDGGIQIVLAHRRRPDLRVSVALDRAGGGDGLVIAVDVGGDFR
jgi:hypothetical protein